jgi:hypothetical protein
VEALVGPETIDVGRHIARLSTKPTERRHVLIGDIEGCESAGKRILIELRIRSGSRNRPDIGDKIDLDFLQQFDELLKAPG